MEPGIDAQGEGLIRAGKCAQMIFLAPETLETSILQHLKRKSRPGCAHVPIWGALGGGILPKLGRRGAPAHLGCTDLRFTGKGNAVLLGCQVPPAYGAPTWPT